MRGEPGARGHVARARREGSGSPETRGSLVRSPEARMPLEQDLPGGAASAIIEILLALRVGTFSRSFRVF